MRFDWIRLKYAEPSHLGGRRFHAAARSADGTQSREDGSGREGATWVLSACAYRPVGLNSVPGNMHGSSITRRRIRHALGYVGLEMFEAARAELAAVSAAEQSLPAVRAAQIDLHMATKEWPAVVEIGRALARQHPECENAWIGWAYALRELQQVTDARDVLLEAESHHGDTSAVLHYNLACYDALLGAIASARTRLARACRMDERFKEASEDDPDLHALREADRRRKRGR